MVIILGLDINGLTVCRALGKLGVDLVGISEKADSVGSFSKYLSKVFYCCFAEDLLLKFLLSEPYLHAGSKPLLLPTTDRLVDFIGRHYAELGKKFLIGFKNPGLVRSLLDKDQFRSLANTYGLRVAQGTVFLRRDLPSVADKIRGVRLPVILKTCKKHYAEKKEDALPKAVIFHDHNALLQGLQLFLSKTGKVVVEEYIEGDDTEVFFVFVYCDQQGRVMETFCGQKLRQWPVATGGTASARPYHSPSLVEETIRFFEGIGFTGLGSMEYKLDKRRGAFFAIEPTVGRIDFQEGVAIGNGLNFPALLHAELFGTGYASSGKKSERQWVCFDADYNAASNNAQLSMLGKIAYLLRNLVGRKLYSVYDCDDIRPFIAWAKQRFLNDR